MEMIPDGLYQIRGSRMTAGFEVRGGEITACALILRQLLHGPQRNTWIARARKVFEVDISQWAIKEQPNKYDQS